MTGTPMVAASVAIALAVVVVACVAPLASAQCNAVSAVEFTQVLDMTSPGHNRDDCWDVEARVGEIVRVEFTSINMEPIHDHLYVSGESVAGGGPMAIDFAPVVVWDSNRVTIRFTSDVSISSGFIAEYTSMVYPGDYVCGDDVRDELEGCDSAEWECLSDCTGYAWAAEGVDPPANFVPDCVTCDPLPLYIDYSYGPDEDKVWQFDLPEGSWIQLRIEKVDVEPCCDAFMAVYGEVPGGGGSGTTTWTDTSGVVRTYEPNQDVMLRLTSDSSIQYSGIEVFVDVCDESGCQQAEAPKGVGAIVGVVVGVLLVCCCGLICIGIGQQKQDRAAAATGGPVTGTATTVSNAGNAPRPAVRQVTISRATSASSGYGGSSVDDEAPPPYAEALTMSPVKNPPPSNPASRVMNVMGITRTSSASSVSSATSGTSTSGSRRVSTIRL